MRPGRFILGLLAAAALSPAALSAQYVSNARGPLVDRFTLEPYAGLYFDNVRGSGTSFDESGWLGGLRLGLVLADRARLVGDLGYSRVSDAGRVGSGENSAVIASENWLATGGLELDVVPGPTAASLGLQYGAAWRSESLREVLGSPSPVEVASGWARSPVLVPSFSIRHGITPRADLRLGVQDYIFFDNDPVTHNFALTAGISLR